jgi:hypothetical protein
MVRIWQETELPQQTIGFELPDLPGESFRLVIPELISDSEKAILPWSHPSPEWDMGQESARCSVEIHGVVRMATEVLFSGEKIDIIVKVTNLSDRNWHKVNLFTCFAYYTAPAFNDPALSRTLFPVGVNTWRSVAELFEDHNPGEGPYTFFPVRGGPVLSELWVCREINQLHPQLASRGAACVLSKDKKWVAGMTTETPAYLFNNRNECCIHADPLLGMIESGGAVESMSTVFIFQGSLKEFEARLDM